VRTLSAVAELADVAFVTPDPRGRDRVLAAGSPEADAVLRAADVVVCATTSREPLFDSAMLTDDVLVVAIGSHEPDARELDAALLGRSQVVVEDVDTALRECGDVVLAIAEDALTADALVPMRDIVTGAVEVADDRPVVFKGAGMAWQDLAVAARAYQRSGGRTDESAPAVARGRSDQ
jgi:ornithine cyclodeaminase